MHRRTLAFEELDRRETPLGALDLRRRADPRFDGGVVHEVKLGDELLMSSRFTEAAVQLGRSALGLLDDARLDVGVGGLGLGFTAAAALADPSVGTLTVVELLEPVIDWHRRGLVPLGAALSSDPRCTIVQADFFELATTPGAGFDPARARVHAVLLDIDHSPRHWLAPRHGGLYTVAGLRVLPEKLHPRGVFGMWSNDLPDPDFLRVLDAVFESSEAHVVSFPNPYTDGESSNAVYLARGS